MAAAGSAALAQLATSGRQLYRSILRLHRERLPGQMRDLGDSYARAEFSSHFKSKNITVQQAQEFLMQWRGYLAMLSGPAFEAAAQASASSAPAGGAMSDALRSDGGSAAAVPASPAGATPGALAGHDLSTAVDSVRQMSEGLDVYMSPEQRLRMEALRKEAGQLGSAMLHQQPGSSARPHDVSGGGAGAPDGKGQ